MPADGAMTNHDGPATARDPGSTSAAACSRLANLPTMPSDATTVAVPGICAETADRVLAELAGTRSQCPGTCGHHTALMPAACTSTSADTATAASVLRQLSLTSSATVPTGASRYTGRLWNDGIANRRPGARVFSSSTAQITGASQIRPIPIAPADPRFAQMSARFSHNVRISMSGCFAIPFSSASRPGEAVATVPPARYAYPFTPEPRLLWNRSISTTAAKPAPATAAARRRTAHGPAMTPAAPTLIR